MNEKTIRIRLGKLRKLMDEFPPGAAVWHRGDARRGVVTGHGVGVDGGVTVRVDYGAAGPVEEHPQCLSLTKVSDGAEGDEWKEGAV